MLQPVATVHRQKFRETKLFEEVLAEINSPARVEYCVGLPQVATWCRGKAARRLTFLANTPGGGCHRYFTAAFYRYYWHRLTGTPFRAPAGPT
jgi:hypothetical protein